MYTNTIGKNKINTRQILSSVSVFIFFVTSTLISVGLLTNMEAFRYIASLLSPESVQTGVSQPTIAAPAAGVTVTHIDAVETSNVESDAVQVESQNETTPLVVSSSVSDFLAKYKRGIEEVLTISNDGKISADKINLDNDVNADDAKFAGVLKLKEQKDDPHQKDYDSDERAYLIVYAKDNEMYYMDRDGNSHLLFDFTSTGIDALDYEHFKDAMTLDANLTIDPSGSAYAFSIGDQGADDIGGDAQNALLRVDHTMSDLSEFTYGQQVLIDLDPSDASITSGILAGGYFNIDVNNSNSTNYSGTSTLRGLQGQVDHGGSGTVTTAYGTVGTVTNTGSGTITNAYGGRFAITNNDGTITNANAIWAQDTGDAKTNDVGVRVDDFSLGTNNTNILIGSGSVPTGDYSIYNASTYDNYFAGQVGIGTNNPDSGTLLHVVGGNIKVSGGGHFYDDATQLSVPDYVFEPDYALMSLEDLEAYIQTNKHLPNIPDVSDTDGWSALSLQDRDMKLLEKVEELVLYVLDNNNTVDKLAITDDSIRIRESKTPDSATAECEKGQISWDADYIYVCVADDTWNRSPLSDW